MKKFFLPLKNTIRKFAKKYSNNLTIACYIIWIITATIISYNIFPSIHDNYIAQEKDYILYENIINEIIDKDIRNTTLPKNININILMDEITISNIDSLYSVTGKVSTEGITFTRYSAILERKMENFFVNGIVMGTFLLGCLGGLILYCLFYFILCFLEIIYKFICDFKKEFKNEKNRFIDTNKPKDK